MVNSKIQAQFHKTNFDLHVKEETSDTLLTNSFLSPATWKPFYAIMLCFLVKASYFEVYRHAGGETICRSTFSTAPLN